MPLGYLGGDFADPLGLQPCGIRARKRVTIDQLAAMLLPFLYSSIEIRPVDSCCVSEYDHVWL